MPEYEIEMALRANCDSPEALVNLVQDLIDGNVSSSAFLWIWSPRDERTVVIDEDGEEHVVE